MGNFCSSTPEYTNENTIHSNNNKTTTNTNVDRKSHAAPVIDVKNDKWELRKDGIGVSSEARSNLIAVHNTESKVTESYYGSNHPDLFHESNKLGQGGTATVYDAKQKGTDFRVALKKVDLHSFNQSQTEMLLKEVEVGKLLDHPNTIKIIAIYREQFILYVVMEIATGGSLVEDMQRQPHAKYSDKRLRPIASKMLRALAYLHANKIVHRDVKLDNFVFTSSRADATLKLIDFGVSRQCFEGDKMTRTTGTPIYMAPEVIGNSYDTKVDLWSVGVTLYVMLTGNVPPFQVGEMSDKDSIVERAKHPLRLIQLIQSGLQAHTVSEECIAFMTHLFQVDSEQRYSAAEALMDPWITGPSAEATTTTRQSMTAIGSNFELFKDRSSLQKVGMLAMTVGLSNEKAKELNNEFLEMDTNQDGILSLDEFRTGMLKFATMSPEVVEACFVAIDQDSSGFIQYSEFIAAAMDQSESEHIESLEAAFHRMDIDDSGFITLEELRQLLPPDTTAERAEEIMTTVDRNGDGRLGVDEFIQMMSDTGVQQMMLGSHEDKRKLDDAICSDSQLRMAKVINIKAVKTIRPQAASHTFVQTTLL